MNAARFAIIVSNIYTLVLPSSQQYLLFLNKRPLNSARSSYNFAAALVIAVLIASADRVKRKTTIGVRKKEVISIEMIYSKKYDFLFIKGKKVAGTSVEIALASVCGPDDIIAPITPIDELERLNLGHRGAQNYSKDPEGERVYLEKLAACKYSETTALDLITAPKRKFFNHMPLTKFINHYGSLPTKRIFCIERSPYAKVISASNMSRKFGDYKRAGRPMEFNRDDLKQAIDRKFKHKSFSFCKNIDLYRDASGEVNIRALRYEYLSKEFADLMTEYGVSPVPTLPHAKQGANSNEIDPKEVFTREQLDYINEIFAEEFLFFGYTIL